MALPRTKTQAPVKLVHAHVPPDEARSRLLQASQILWEALLRKAQEDGILVVTKDPKQQG